MATDINLLPQRKIGFFTEERLLLWSRIAAVVAVVLVLTTSILFFLLSRDPTLSRLKSDQSQTIAQLTLLQDKTAKYLLIVDRVSKIKTLLTKKVDFDATLTTITQQIPPGANITALVLDKNTLSLSVSSRDLSLLGTTVTNFTNLIAGKKVLKNLTIQGLVSDEKGGIYVLSITGALL